MNKGIFSSLFSSSKKQEKPSINWNALTNVSQLDELEKISLEHPVLIFKHSTRCSISAMALNKFERDFQSNTNIHFWFLDLIQYREVSNKTAEKFGVEHQSPQIIMLSKGNVVHHASHNGIYFTDLLQNI